MLGWSAKAPILINEYSEYVLEGSQIDVIVLDPPEDVIDAIADLDTELDNVRVQWINKDPLSAADLATLRPFDYNNVIILPQRPGIEVPAERTDAETIVVLLHLRKLRREFEAEGAKPRRAFSPRCSNLRTASWCGPPGSMTSSSPTAWSR